MSDDDFEIGRGRGGAAALEQGIPRWQSHPPPGLRQYLEHQRASMGQGAGAQQPPAVAPAAVDGMEQALDVMERALEEQNSWKSSILPRGHHVEGFLTRHGLLAKLKVLCHNQGCGTEEMSKAQLRLESTYTDGSAASPHDDIVVNRR